MYIKSGGWGSGLRGGSEEEGWGGVFSHVGLCEVSACSVSYLLITTMNWIHSCIHVVNLFAHEVDRRIPVLGAQVIAYSHHKENNSCINNFYFKECCATLWCCGYLERR